MDNIDLQEFTVDKKAEYQKFLNISNNRFSDLAFGSLFMWAEYYSLKYFIYDDLLCVTCTGGSFPPSMFLPLGELTPEKLQTVIDFIYPYFNQNGWKLIISHADENKMHLTKEIKGYTLLFKYNRDYSDYIYNTKAFLEMKGSTYHSLKNSIKSFQKHNPACVYETMNDSLLDECYDLMKRWKIQKGIEADCPQIKLLLKDFSSIDLKGGAVRVNGRIESFIIGEKNHDTGYIHAGKANIDINGLYAYTMREFVRNEMPDTLTFNRSDDLGIPSLRHAKLLYNPSEILHKYNIHFQKI